MGFVQIREKMESLEVSERKKKQSKGLSWFLGDYSKKEGTVGEGKRREEDEEKQVCLE